MGRKKACGPDDLPIEAIMMVAEMKPELSTYILQRIMADDIPDSWKKSKLIPILKNKGDILEYNNYRGITLMSHFMKLWERIIATEHRCRRPTVFVPDTGQFLDSTCIRTNQSSEDIRYSAVLTGRICRQRRNTRTIGQQRS